MKRNISIYVNLVLWYREKLPIEKGDRTRGRSASRILLLLLVVPAVRAENWKIAPTWLYRYVPRLNYAPADLTSPTCHYKPIFGQGDNENRSMITVARFGEATLDARGNCQPVEYQREEELYFVLQGKGILHDVDQNYPIRAHDFTYLAPGRKHSIENSAQQPMRVVLMTFKIPSSVAISRPPTPAPKIVNLDEVKEQTVEGHPTSVLYKLLAGPREGARDAIDEAYVVVSLFWMDFAPGGTNFPHHHQTAEEIYFVVDGQGEMVAGGGMNGVAGRHPAKAGDAYYFRPNCTVGFYNQNKAGAKAHILAVRARIPRPKDED